MCTNVMEIITIATFTMWNKIQNKFKIYMMPYGICLHTPPPHTYAAYVTSSDLESRIEGCIGERDNSFKIVRSIKLNWFGNVKNTRYVHWPNISFKEVYRGKRREGAPGKSDLTTSQRGLLRT